MIIKSIACDVKEDQAETSSKYQKHWHFPRLKMSATPKWDVTELTGEQLVVEDSWRVFPNQNLNAKL
ncbi:hypothetical protein [Tuberibacillus sp. Marseille-P3662]|uniref:hypothetical protein n=1 Tax=Tuberibacillus sp. Marseille-P3662 TaxID=1965358 RepID=UPI000A1C8ED3|nr:hypothetical protein [Tuberibacillus sp. Marseille-P3662]